MNMRIRKRHFHARFWYWPEVNSLLYPRYYNEPRHKK